MRRWIPMLALLLGCSGCPTPPTPAPPPPPDPNAGPTCAAACARASQLGCVWAAPTLEGAPCVEVCANIQDSGYISWNLACRAQASSCDAIEACEK
jgi:hypothetical protein